MPRSTVVHESNTSLLVKRGSKLEDTSVLGFDDKGLLTYFVLVSSAFLYRLPTVLP